jgi:hypothetical protein
VTKEIINVEAKDQTRASSVGTPSSDQLNARALVKVNVYVRTNI